MGYRPKTVNELLGGDSSIGGQIFQAVRAYGSLMSGMADREYKETYKLEKAKNTVESTYQAFMKSIMTHDPKDLETVAEDFYNMDNKNTLQTPVTRHIRKSIDAKISRSKVDLDELKGINGELLKQEYGQPYDHIDFSYYNPAIKGSLFSDPNVDQRGEIEKQKNILEDYKWKVSQSSYVGSFAGKEVLAKIDEKLKGFDALELALGKDGRINKQADITFVQRHLAGDTSAKDLASYYWGGKKIYSDAAKGLMSATKTFNDNLALMSSIDSTMGEELEKDSPEQIQFESLQKTNEILKEKIEGFKVTMADIENRHSRDAIKSDEEGRPRGEDYKKYDWARIGDYTDPQMVNTEYEAQLLKAVALGGNEEKLRLMSAEEIEKWINKQSAKEVDDIINNKKVRENSKLDPGVPEPGAGVYNTGKTNTNEPVADPPDDKDVQKKSQLLKNLNLMEDPDGGVLTADGENPTDEQKRKYKEGLKKINKADKVAQKEDSSNKDNTEHSRTQWFQRNRKAIRTAFGGDKIEEGLMQKLAKRFREEGLLGLGDNGEAMDLNKTYDHK